MKQTTLLLAVLVVASSLFSGSLAAHVVVASTVNMFESAGQVSFSYTLSQKPTIPVSVNLQSSCLKLSQCTTTFSPSIWNVSQSLTVYLDANSNFTCCPVTATLVGDPLFSGQQTQTNVCMISAPPSISQSSGDPHFRTFDGVAYSAFATGDFYLTREISGNFAVQVRQTNCGGTVSCNSAVAIKYQSCVLYVYTSSKGALEVTLVGNETSNGVQITQKSSSTILFTAPTRMQVSVTSFARSNTYFLDMYLSAPSSLSGGLVGLAGYYDGKAANDFLLPNGTIASSAAAFNLGWQVATSEDLFLSSSATIPALFSSPTPPPSALYGVSCGAAAVVGNLVKFTSSNTATSSPLRKVAVPALTTSSLNCTMVVASLSSTESVTVHATCNAAFALSAVLCCKNLLGASATDSFFASCLCDVAISGDVVFATSSAQAFLSNCGSTCS